MSRNIEDIRQGFTDQAAQLQAIIDDPDAPQELKDKARQALAMIPQMQAMLAIQEPAVGTMMV